MALDYYLFWLSVLSIGKVGETLEEFSDRRVSRGFNANTAVGVEAVQSHLKQLKAQSLREGSEEAVK